MKMEVEVLLQSSGPWCKIKILPSAIDVANDCQLTVFLLKYVDE